MCSRCRRGVLPLLAFMAVAALSSAGPGCSCPGDPGHPPPGEPGPPAMSAGGGASADTPPPPSSTARESEPVSLATVEGPAGLTMESPISVLSGLQAGDVVMAVNGIQLSSPIAVRQAYLELHARGSDEDEVTYRRGGDTHTITVGEGPSARVDRSEPAATITRVTPSRYLVDRTRLAADVGDEEALAEQLPSLAPVTVEDVGSGQRVMRLPRRSIFGDLGLRNGDILLRVGELPFETPSQLLERLLDPDTGEVTVTLIRRGREQEISYAIASGSAPADESRPGPESQPSSEGP